MWPRQHAQVLHRRARPRVARFPALVATKGLAETSRVRQGRHFETRGRGVHSGPGGRIPRGLCGRLAGRSVRLRAARRLFPEAPSRPDPCPQVAPTLVALFAYFSHAPARADGSPRGLTPRLQVLLLLPPAPRQIIRRGGAPRRPPDRRRRASPRAGRRGHALSRGGGVPRCGRALCGCGAGFLETSQGGARSRLARSGIIS